VGESVPEMINVNVMADKTGARSAWKACVQLETHRLNDVIATPETTTWKRIATAATFHP